jgi:hypothetical protein
LHTSEFIYQVIKNQARETELRWVDQKSTLDLKGLSLAFVMCPRFISKSVISHGDSIFPGWSFQSWSLDRLVRVFFLCLMAEKSNDEQAYMHQMNLLFDTAEMNEAVALFSAMPVLAYGEQWVLRATDAVRSNIGPVFDAIAFGNPYPAIHFSELAWNQLVLKCIFNDKPIHQIFGLMERNNATLAQTLSDFAHERWAAGRRVPSQVWRLSSPFLTESLLSDIEYLLSHKDPKDILAGTLVLQESDFPGTQALKEKYGIKASAQLSWAPLETAEPIY